MAKCCSCARHTTDRDKLDARICPSFFCILFYPFALVRPAPRLTLPCGCLCTVAPLTPPNVPKCPVLRACPRAAGMPPPLAWVAWQPTRPSPAPRQVIPRITLCKWADAVITTSENRIISGCDEIHYAESLTAYEYKYVKDNSNSIPFCVLSY